MIFDISKPSGRNYFYQKRLRCISTFGVVKADDHIVPRFDRSVITAFHIAADIQDIGHIAVFGYNGQISTAVAAVPERSITGVNNTVFTGVLIVQQIDRFTGILNFAKRADFSGIFIGKGLFTAQIAVYGVMAPLEIDSGFMSAVIDRTRFAGAEKNVAAARKKIVIDTFSLQTAHIWSNQILPAVSSEVC